MVVVVVVVGVVVVVVVTFDICDQSIYISSGANFRKVVNQQVCDIFNSSGSDIVSSSSSNY